MPLERLDGWKEIAGYLQKSVRTVQRWATERDLPVHHVPPSGGGAQNKGSVYALREELDRWLAGPGRDAMLVNGGPTDEENAQVERSSDGSNAIMAPWAHLRHLAPWLIWIAASIGAVALAAFLLRQPVSPTAVAIGSDNKLLVLGPSGEVLWTKQFKRLFEQEVASAQPVKLCDLDGDSRVEVVAAEVPESNRVGGKVVCFEHDGTRRWQYSPGGKITWNGFDHSDTYILLDFSTSGRLGNGKKFVVVIGNHEYSSPSQATVLNSKGQIIGEYWHTGWIMDHLVMDLDRDGVDEIVLGGVDDLRGQAFLAAIKPNIPKSISPVPPGYAPGFLSGKELGYYLFPKSEVSEAMARSSRVNCMRGEDSDHFNVEIKLPLSGGRLDIIERTYFFDRNFQTLQVRFEDPLLGLYSQLRREGVLKHDLGEQEKTRLRSLEVVSAQHSK